MIIYSATPKTDVGFLSSVFSFSLTSQTVVVELRTTHFLASFKYEIRSSHGHLTTEYCLFVWFVFCRHFFSFVFILLFFVSKHYDFYKTQDKLEHKIIISSMCAWRLPCKLVPQGLNPLREHEIWSNSCKDKTKYHVHHNDDQDGLQI